MTPFDIEAYRVALNWFDKQGLHEYRDAVRVLVRLAERGLTTDQILDALRDRCRRERDTFKRHIWEALMSRMCRYHQA